MLARRQLVRFSDRLKTDGIEPLMCRLSAGTEPLLLYGIIFNCADAAKFKESIGLVASSKQGRRYHKTIPAFTHTRSSHC
jgi:hypothetical protein